jgi:hypothetical protein
MALALQVHVRDKPQLLDNWHKQPWRYFRDYVDEVRVRHLGERTFHLEARDKNHSAANPSFLLLVLVDEILRSFGLLALAELTALQPYSTIAS